MKARCDHGSPAGARQTSDQLGERRTRVEHDELGAEVGPPGAKVRLQLARAERLWRHVLTHRSRTRWFVPSNQSVNCWSAWM